MKPESTKTDEKSWALPDGSISIEEFEKKTKEAEKGPFLTLDELKKGVNEWKKGQKL